MVYVFNNLSHLTHLRADIHPDMQKLAEVMHDAWIAFAHRGNPATTEVLWPKYNLEERATLIFDEDTQVVYDPESEKRKRIATMLA
ncbi:MAG TPA: hypothetical protein DEA91_26950 [Paenibacillus sp.]|nr:hypothetical protein [Paenibacillus sp.]